MGGNMTGNALYGIVALTGRSWSVEYAKEIKPIGSITSKNLSGYGDFPVDRFPNLPVIRLDKVQAETVNKYLAIPDADRPSEQNTIFTGTLNGFLDEVAKLFIPIDNYFNPYRIPVLKGSEYATVHWIINREPTYCIVELHECLIALLRIIEPIADKDELITITYVEQKTDIVVREYSLNYYEWINKRWCK